MKQAEFDKFAEEYASLHRDNIAISGEAPSYFAEYKIRDLVREFHASRGAKTLSPSILDFGSGVGTSVPHVRKHLPDARVTCLDVSAKSLDIGRQHYSDEASFVHFAGDRIPFPDHTFDIAFAACVFHHIEHAEHVRLLGELRRVLVRGGMALIFEHNPFNPLTIRAVNTCAFDENAHLIRPSAMRQRMKAAGFRSVRTSYRVFFPRALRALRFLERHMMWFPAGAQYYAVGLQE